jgi:hypothetical protein
MSDYTICYDNKLNKVYLKKSNQTTDNKNIINSHIPYDSYENNALSDLNNQLNNIYDSKNNYDVNNNYSKNNYDVNNNYSKNNYDVNNNYSKNNYDANNNYSKNIFPKNNNEFVEVDSSLFFEKFKHQRGPKGEQGIQGIQGLRGFPGIAGKDGVCNCGDFKHLLQRIDTLEKIVIELSKKNNKENTVNIQQEVIENIKPKLNIDSKINYVNNISNGRLQNDNSTISRLQNDNSANSRLQNDNSANDKKILKYGIKISNNEERNFKNLNSNNDIKLTFRPKQRLLFYDTLYLSDELYNNLITNYSIQDMNIDIFKNKYENNDIQYFPTNINTIYGNVIKLNGCGLNIIKLKNIVCNIKQSINNNSNNIVGIMYNTNKIIEKNLSLFIFFELHSKINKDNYKNNERMFPYYNNRYNQNSPNNTCLNTVKKIKINKTNNIFDEDDEVEISFLNDLNLNDVLLYIRIGLTKKNEEELLGTDINNNQIYGYIPLNEFNISFEYDVL